MEKEKIKDKKYYMKMLGEAILYSSIQFSIGSVEMSSKFSVKNFSKDQITLQNAADALSDYLKVSVLWTIGVMLLLFGKYGYLGGIIGFVSNLLVVMWIYVSYIKSFDIAAVANNLKKPKVNLFIPLYGDST